MRLSDLFEDTRRYTRLTEIQIPKRNYRVVVKTTTPQDLARSSTPFTILFDDAIKLTDQSLDKWAMALTPLARMDLSSLHDEPIKHDYLDQKRALRKEFIDAMNKALPSLRLKIEDLDDGNNSVWRRQEPTPFVKFEFYQPAGYTYITITEA